MKLCKTCQVNPSYRSQAACKECWNAVRRSRYQENPAKYTSMVSKFRKTRKQVVISEYGGKCVCCGEANTKFLTMDHMDGKGCEHRREIGNVNFYDWLKSKGYPKDKFQILCFNCNCGRAHNRGICPHNETAV